MRPLRGGTAVVTRRFREPAPSQPTEAVPIAASASAGREPALGRTVVRGVDDLVMDVSRGVTLGRPARPDLLRLLVDAVHQDRNPDLTQEGLNLHWRWEHPPAAATGRGGEVRLRLLVRALGADLGVRVILHRHSLRDAPLPGLGGGSGVGLSVSLFQWTVWSTLTAKDSNCGSPSTASMHAALPPTYVLMRSTSVATHQPRSSGHHRLALSGHPNEENAVPAALSGPRSNT